MKQWQTEKENPQTQEERIKKQNKQTSTVSKKVNVGSMIAWHELAKDILPTKPDIETNVPESNIKDR